MLSHVCYNINMTQIRFFMGILHNQLETFERMISASKVSTQDSIVHAMLFHSNLEVIIAIIFKSSLTHNNGPKEQQNFYSFLKQNKDRSICQTCEKQRHVASSCFLLKDVLLGKTSYASLLGPSIMTTQSFISKPSAKVVGSFRGNTWLLDSDGSHHLTPNENIVPNFVAYDSSVGIFVALFIHLYLSR